MSLTGISRCVGLVLSTDKSMTIDCLYPRDDTLINAGEKAVLFDFNAATEETLVVPVGSIFDARVTVCDQYVFGTGPAG